jgi:2-oxo-4-hydroxy-4-carboxy-5-ureidoimidazoline decarboxylase
MRKLSDLNVMPDEEFVRIVGPVFEHSSWVADRVTKERPFASRDALHAAMCRVVRAAPFDEKLELIRAHPDLVGKMAAENRLTSESAREQSAAGLTGLSPDEVAQFEQYNAAYRRRFGFPFVICARENRKEAILAAFPQRLQHSGSLEMATALAEIEKIARLRLFDLIEDNHGS